VLQLARIRGENFRLFQKLDLNLHPRFNLILGENAAGKTTFLEAIYCLGRAKSFRGSSPSELAGINGRHWSLRGRFRLEETPPEDVAVNWTSEGISIRQGQQANSRVADLVKSWPVQVIEPAMHRLLQDGPGYRRSFLDWGVFHVEQNFFPQWRTNQRALRQRNKTLRTKASKPEISIWNRDLAASAEALHSYRKAHLKQMTPLIEKYVAAIFNEAGWSAELYPGWPDETDYTRHLEQHLDRDRRMGMTMDGAHRAELRLKVDRVQVKNRISRGQQKLLIAALVLSQARLIYQQTQRAPILLVDDFSAELAAGFQDVFLQMLMDYPGQVFLTAFERHAVFDSIGDLHMFHVEHGRVAQC
jgi:DNA replication and repair protein RecF